MRVLKLSHKEIETIEEVLNSYYNRGIKFLSDNSDIINEETRLSILKDINAKAELKEQISKGEKDV